MTQQPTKSNEPLDSRILSVLKDMVEHHSSSRGVAEKMGQAHNYVARILRGETKLRLDVLGRILETLGVSERFFFKLVTADGSVDNALEILRFYKADGPPPAAFIEGMQQQVGRILSEEAPPASGYESRRGVLAQLEERRHQDKDAVRSELEGLMSSWVEAGVCRGLMADLAEALAIWGTTQRFEGLRRDASLAFQLSLALSSSAGCHRVIGMGQQKASYLLRDLGCNQAGLILLDGASSSYLRAGDIVACAKVFVDRGILLMSIMAFDPAVSELETALRLLPEEEWRNRAAAYSNLAACYEQSGRLRLASRHLMDAQRVYGDHEDAVLAHILWNQGNIALACKRPAEAEHAFMRSMNLLEHYGKPLDYAYVALSLAEAYVDQRKLESMRRLADQMLAWLPAIRGNRVADSVMMEWIRCAKWGEVTHQALREARHKLSRAAKA